MTKDEMRDVIRKFEFVEYHDPEAGLIIWCPDCGGFPEKLTPDQEHLVVERGRPGHEPYCKIARALYGPPDVKSDV